MTAMPSLTQTATFITDTVIIGNSLDAATAFTTMALMDQLRASMTIIPWCSQQVGLASRLHTSNMIFQRNYFTSTTIVYTGSDE